MSLTYLLLCSQSKSSCWHLICQTAGGCLMVGHRYLSVGFIQKSLHSCLKRKIMFWFIFSSVVHQPCIWMLLTIVVVGLFQITQQFYNVLKFLFHINQHVDRLVFRTVQLYVVFCIVVKIVGTLSRNKVFEMYLWPCNSVIKCDNTMISPLI